MRRTRRVLLTALFAVVALVVALVAARLTVAEFLIPRALAMVGVDVEQVEVAALSLRHARVESLRLRIADEGIEGHVSLASLTLDYRPVELLRGRVDAVRIVSLNGSLRLPVEDGGAGAPVALLAPGRVFAALPFDSLEVEQLDYSMRGPDGRVWHLSGRAGFGDMRLAAAIGLALEQEPLARLEASLDADGALRLTVNPAAGGNGPWLTVDGRVRSEDGRVVGAAGTLRADIADAGRLPVAVDPGLTGEVQLEWQVEVEEAGGAAAFEGELALTLPEPHRGVRGLQLQGPIGGTFSGDTLKLTLKPALVLRAQLLPAAWLPQRDATALLGSAALPVRVAVEETTPVEVVVAGRDGALPQVRVGGPLQLRVGGDSEAGPLFDARAAGLGFAPDRWHVETLRGEGKWRRPTGADVPVRALEYAFSGRGKGGGDGVALVAETVEVDAEGISAAAGSASGVTVGLRSPVEIGIEPDGVRLGALQVAARVRALHAASVGIPKLAATIGLPEGIETGAPWRAKLAGEAFELEWEGRRVPWRRLQGELRGDGRRLSLKGSLANDPLSLEFEAQHDLAEGRGKAIVQVPAVTFRKGGFTPATRVHGWGMPFNLESGQVGADADARWGPDNGVQADASVRLLGVGGYLGASVFDGLYARARLGLAPTLRTLEPVNVNLERFHSGVELTDIAAALELAPGTGGVPRITVADARGQLLGGELWLETLHIGGAEPERFPLYVQGIDLAQVLALERQQGLEGRGTIDGRLPLSIGDGGVVVDGGWLLARDPGLIRYRPNEAARALADSNPNIGLAIRALSNYHYETLSASVGYAADGALTLALHLEGRNPELNAGQPVNFNISVEENIPALLKSLRLAEDISTEIGRRAQEVYGR